MMIGRAMEAAGGVPEETCGADGGAAPDPPLRPEVDGRKDAEVVAGVCEGVVAHCASAARVLGPTTP